jgi:glycosyltransferase involved in cell wall biosynthesis
MFIRGKKNMRKINVLQFITPTGFYGAEMWILALSKYLDPAKINCQLFVTNESECQNIEIYNRFKALGLNAHQIKMNGRFDPRVILKQFRLIKQNKIDIIHTHGYKSDILGILVAKLTGIKAVSTPHGFENVKDIKLQLFISLGCISLRLFDRVVPLSEELHSGIKKIGVNTNKIRLILNGVDLEEIEWERKRKWSSTYYKNTHERRIVYVGQIAFRKNISDLIKTFDILYKEQKNIRLIIIGDGPDKNKLEQEAASLSSGHRIDFLGYRDDRLRLLKEMHLFVMTSSLEGIPRCMMEAMAMELPVAAYRIPGVDKLVIQGKTGLMVDFGDIVGLKKCWEKLLFDKEYAKQIARNGREYILKNYSAKRMAEEYTSLYSELNVKYRN